MMTTNPADDASGNHVSPFLPTAELVEPGSRKPAKRPSQKFTWIWVLAGAAALIFIFICGGLVGLFFGADLSRPVRISATIEYPPPQEIGPSSLQVSYRAVGDLDDRQAYIWVIRHGNQRMPPRSISAWEMRQGGSVEFFLFDYQATSAEIWIETDNRDGSAREKVSNVIRVRTKRL